jgi:hypothetical protein
MTKTPTRTVIYRTLTPAQVAWMKEHVGYECVGKPRPGVRFNNCGTLHGDGTFEPLTKKPRRRQAAIRPAIRPGRRGDDPAAFLRLWQKCDF